MQTCRALVPWIALLAGLLAAPLPAADPPPSSCCCPLAVRLVLGPAEGTATPHRTCCAHAGGGNVLVTQPANDTIATSLTGVVVAKCSPLGNAEARYSFELTQCFEVVISDPNVPTAKLLMEGRVVGLLRSPKCCGGSGASAAVSVPAQAAVQCGSQELLALSLPPRSASCGEDLSVYNREGPVCIHVLPGKYTLHEVFGIQATGSKWAGWGPSAEFAPESALDAHWISPHEPFHGANKKSFGFQVIVKVVPADGVNLLNPEPGVPRKDAPSPAPKAP
jgi:hypothetical protein